MSASDGPIVESFAHCSADDCCVIVMAMKSAPSPASQELAERVTIPRAAGLGELDESIVQLILGLSFKDKTAEEIASILEDSGVGRDAARDAAKKYIAAGAPGVAVSVLVQLLRKRVVQEVVGQKTLTLWLKVLAVVWTLFDARLFVTSPATRITVPTVAMVSSFRLRQRLDDAAPFGRGG